MKKILNLLVIVIALSVLFCAVGCSDDKEKQGSSSLVESTFTMEEIGKEIKNYTWEEFESLSGEEQIKFQNSFENEDDFEGWMIAAKTEADNLPWNNGGKQPSEYTWEEFEALSGPQQIQFQNSFESSADFEEWYNREKPD